MFSLLTSTMACKECFGGCLLTIYTVMFLVGMGGYVWSGQRGSELAREVLREQQTTALEIKTLLLFHKAYVYDTTNTFANATHKCFYEKPMFCTCYLFHSELNLLAFLLPPVSKVIKNENEYNQFSDKPLQKDEYGLFV